MDRTKHLGVYIMLNYKANGIANKYEDAWEQFRLSNKLTRAEMSYLLSFSQGARDAVFKLSEEMP
tara:strand:+ start:1227 stop:1421 length:195 start_codon:yes stop_codon:yes gene_type:complete